MTLPTEHFILQRDERAPAIEALGRRVADLLRRTLVSSEIVVHSVTHRVKDPDSLRRKLTTRVRRYETLDSVTDLLGLRIITYFPDDVDRVAQIVEDTFDTDRENSIDRRATLEPDRFGYLSLHYVVALTSKQAALPEYRAHAGFKFEIQIRSILQHAWAEIEHDLGYKSRITIPEPLRRRFFRLAGLLEGADSEFVTLRDEVARYTTQTVESLLANPLLVGIDRDSIMIYVTSSALVQRLDQAIQTAIRAPSISPINDSAASERASELVSLGYSSLGEIDRDLTALEGTIEVFAKILTAPDPDLMERFGETLPEEEDMFAGASLWYLFFLELGRRYVAGDRTIKLDYGVVFSPAGGAHFGEGALELVASAYKIASATQ